MRGLQSVLMLRTLIIVILCLLPTAAWAQSVVLRASDVLPLLTEAAPDAFYVNGTAVHGLGVEAETPFVSHDAQRLAVSLVALRLIDQGKLSLDTPVAQILPELIEKNPFRVALTLRHLLTETGGFAVPPVATDGPPENLTPFLIELRTPGQVSAPDPTGLDLLELLVARTTSQSVQETIALELFKPLGLHDKNSATDSATLASKTVTLSPKILAHLAILLLRNEQSDGTPYLSDLSYEMLMEGVLWLFHPLGPERSAAGYLQRRAGRSWVEINPGFVVFPREGAAFISPRVMVGGSDIAARFKQAIWRIAEENFPPHSGSTTRLEAARALAPPADLGGRYTRADRPSAWLRARVDNMAENWIRVNEMADGNLRVTMSSPAHEAFGDAPPQGTLTFQPKAPYHYTSDSGERLTFSPVRAGGYLYLDGVLYRYTGLLGNIPFLLSLLPWVFAALTSAALHLQSNLGKPWRRMALFSLIGSALIGGGLYAEWALWPTVMYEWDSPALITLWRSGLNIGLMLVLSLPLFALSFVRRGPMPEKGWALILAGPHLALISIAAMTLFLITVAVGLAGTFTAL
ncbi:serine hydrolase [Kordiimonas sp.]|uniref:serine hydrolase n=1 Tax=Kordiimonas sp. TaxID=1970157 RepID=UPI003B52D2CC